MVELLDEAAARRGRAGARISSRSATDLCVTLVLTAELSNTKRVRARVVRGRPGMAECKSLRQRPNAYNFIVVYAALSVAVLPIGVPCLVSRV